MKKWIDANIIAEQETEGKRDKWEYEKLMKQKPNFDKSKESKNKRNNYKFKYKK